MPKELFRETDVTKQVSKITFGVENRIAIRELSVIPIVSSNLYHRELKTPVNYGVLDPRLGVNNKELACGTCGNKLHDCMGHYGHIDLELPVFHVGYFKHIIAILQTICKECSKVLLPQEEKNRLGLRMSNPNLDYNIKKSLRTKIIEKCKKVVRCPHCKAYNGFIKKMPQGKGDDNSFLKISWDKHRGRNKETVISEELEKFKEAIKLNPELKQYITAYPQPLTLNPLDVYRIFSLIPLADMPLLGMNPKQGMPADLIVWSMLVPPACIRPSSKSDLKAGTTEDDLTVKQSEIVLINRTIKGQRENSAPFNYFNTWDYLQLQAALFINSQISGIPPALMVKKPSRGLVQRLKGKQGRLRSNLMGKRVNFTARTVISPDPNLQIDQVGVPQHIAKILTYPERVTPHNIDLMKQLVMNGCDNWPGANYIELKQKSEMKSLRYGNREKLARELEIGDTVERHLRDNDIVLFNRQPSLHRLSIMALRVKVHKFRTLRFNECVCNPYNADFDGDEMNLHLPQTEEAKAEALVLMGNKYNLITPRNGEILIAAIQDFITGAYLITKKDTFFEHREALDFISRLIADDDIDLQYELPVPCILKPVALWSGKQLISLIFRPNKKHPVKANLEARGKCYTKNKEFCVKDSYVIIRNSELIAGILDKNHLGSGTKQSNIFYVILKDFGESHAIKSLWRLGKVALYYLMNRGFSIGTNDVTPNEDLLEEKRKLLQNAYDYCHNLINQLEQGKLEPQPGCTPNETFEAMVMSELSSVRDRMGKVCEAKLPSTCTPLIMSLCGSKGSLINIAQMVACLGQQAVNGKRAPEGFEDRSLPHFKKNIKTPEAKGFVENSFYSGLSPTEFMFHTMAGREGLVDTAVKTAETGYMQRRLIKTLEDLVVQYDGTVRNAEGGVVQLSYGYDGLDPINMEGQERPVDFDRVLKHIQAKEPFRRINHQEDESALTGEQIRRATSAFFDTGRFNECSKQFQKEIRDFMEEVAERVDRNHEKFRHLRSRLKIVDEIDRITCSQVVTFFETCIKKYLKAIIEPGTTVGALAAQSIGEPGTQMTLKTFHFAGVASMNITEGVPRIKEIINATKEISTPVIKTPLINSDDMEFAKEVKARIEKVYLEEVTECIHAIYEHTDCYLKIDLNLDRINMLKLKVDANSIRASIYNTSKLKLRPSDVTVENESAIVIHPNIRQGRSPNMAIEELKVSVLKVIIKGFPTVNRVVVAPEEIKGTTQYKLYVEGNNYRDVMGIYGVLGKHTISNNVMEVYRTLGIEAARQIIMDEIMTVMKNHSMSVDYRHIMLLAAQMTHTGQVLGITRHGLVKMKQSVLNLASFEQTAEHLFDAAYFGQTDKISGVSESIIMGKQIPAGTGLFDLLLEVKDVDRNPKIEKTLFESAFED